jgi:hypothetical protein
MAFRRAKNDERLAFVASEASMAEEARQIILADLNSRPRLL